MIFIDLKKMCSKKYGLVVYYIVRYKKKRIKLEPPANLGKRGFGYEQNRY